MIEVTDEMVEAAIARLNELQAADAKLGVVLLPWGDVVREVYIAMERSRRLSEALGDFKLSGLGQPRGSA